MSPLARFTVIFPRKLICSQRSWPTRSGASTPRPRRPQPSENPVDALHSMLVIASRRLLERPLLTTAMLHASLAANPETVTEASVADQTFRAPDPADSRHRPSK